MQYPVLVQGMGEVTSLRQNNVCFFKEVEKDLSPSCWEGHTAYNWSVCGGGVWQYRA